MPRATNAICGTSGCPQIIKTGDGKCPTHRKQADAQRGTTTQRGYGNKHQQLRTLWVKRIATGTVPCARCQHLIQPGTAWDLGHSDDRRTYIGPEHATCNRTAAGHTSHRYK